MALLLHARAKKFSRQEYYKLAESGVLAAGDRVELIDGTIVAMSPQNLAHSTAITLATAVLNRLFHSTHLVSSQTPIVLSDLSEPEPDFSLFTPAHLNECLGRGTKPTRPDLVIEVSDPSYAYDTNEKANLYAASSIAEYWVLDLQKRRLEVRQEPGPDPDGTFGHSYRLLHILTEDQRVAPRFAPTIRLLISDLLPPIL